MTLSEVFKAEGLDEVAAADMLFFASFRFGQKPRQREAPVEWTKTTDGCWYAEGWRFIPAIAKLGDLQGAFDDGRTSVG